MFVTAGVLKGSPKKIRPNGPADWPALVYNICIQIYTSEELYYIDYLLGKLEKRA